MAVLKKIEGDEFYLYMNGELIYKRWLKTGQSKVFDIAAYDRYTFKSITDFDVNAEPKIIQLKAKITLLPTIKGGRQTGIKTKYRPNHVFEYQDNQILRTYIGEINFDDREWIHPGEEAVVNVRFLLGQPIEQFLEVGRKWWIHEGPRRIGEAVILSIP